MKDVKVLVAVAEVTADARQRASLTASVILTGSPKERVVLTAVPTENGTTIERPLREIADGVVEQFLVTFDATELPAGRHPIRLIAFPSAEAPEEYADRGQTVTVVVPDKSAPPQPPARRIPWLLIGAAAAVLIVVAGLGFVLLRPDTVEVPDLMGLSQAEATKELTSLGFSPKVRETTTDPVDAVTGQQPPAGQKHEKGSAVTIVITPAAIVPNLKGMSRAAAQDTLKRYGLTMTPAEQPWTMPFDSVFEQEPKPGSKVARGSTVTVKISVGIQVPDVENRQYDVVAPELTNLGFTVDKVSVSDGFFRRGFIIDQSLDPGSEAELAEKITLTVSAGNAG